MKNLSVMASVVFCLAVFLVACGGSSAKTVSVSPTGQSGNQVVQQGNSAVGQASPTMQASPTSVPSDQLKVSGNVCPTNIVKVTSKDVIEALVNTICTDHRNPGTVVFSSPEEVQTGDQQRRVFNLNVGFRDCQDCPSDYEVQVSLSVNQLGEWQANPADIIAKETSGSMLARAQRNQDKQAAEMKNILSQMSFTTPLTSLTLDNNNISLTVPVEVVGTPYKLLLLVQLDDGRVVEFSSLFEKGSKSNEFYPNENLSLDKGKTYKFLATAVDIGSGYRSDWAYLNK